MTSLEVKLLILTAAAAVLYLFVTEIRRSRRTSQLIAWVQAVHPAAWNALPWGLRKIHRLGALYQLHKSRAIADPHFETEFESTKSLSRDQRLALAVGIGALLLLALGFELGWWHW